MEKCYRRDQYYTAALLFDRSPFRSSTWSSLELPLSNINSMNYKLKDGSRYHQTAIFPRVGSRVPTEVWIWQLHSSTGALYIMRETLLLLFDPGRILTCWAGLFHSAGLTWHPYKCKAFTHVGCLLRVFRWVMSQNQIISGPGDAGDFYVWCKPCCRKYLRGPSEENKSFFWLVYTTECDQLHIMVVVNISKKTKKCALVMTDWQKKSDNKPQIHSLEDSCSSKSLVSVIHSVL